MKIFTIFWIFPILIYCTNGGQLPSDFIKCRRSDPHFSECIKKAVQDAMHKMKDNGIPDLKVPPLEPLTVPSATIGEGTGAVHVVQHYTNFSIYGLADSRLEDITAIFGPNNHTSIYKSFVPESIFKADYEFNGRILLLPIVGNGKCTVRLTNITANIKLYAETFEKKGETYLEIKDLKMQLFPAKVFFQFDNLFNGDERLGREMNNILNENWKEVFDDVNPGFEKVLETVYKDYANKIFTKVPYRDIFPE